MITTDRHLPSATYGLAAVRYGTFQTHKSAMYAQYALYGEPDAHCTLDYYFWVLWRDDVVALVDTGFDVGVARRKRRQVLHSPVEALQRLGISATAVTHIIVTHFHYDHIGNLREFPNALILAPAEEYRFWMSPMKSRPLLHQAIESRELFFLEEVRHQGRLTLLDNRAEVGVRGLTILTLPGHTPGQIGVRVPTAQGDVIIASDAAHFYEEFERDRPFYLFTHLADMYSTLAHLRELSRHPTTTVVPGHDPEVMRRFPPLDPKEAQLAVRLG